MSEEHPFLGREFAQHERQFSEHTAQVIDEEIAKILHTAEDRAKRTLQQYTGKLNALAEALLEREVVDEDEIRELIGPSVHHMADRSAPTSPAQVASVRE
jgi:cell division protease FtsH